MCATTVSAQEGVLKPGPALLPADTPSEARAGPACLRGSGDQQHLGPGAQTTRVRPLCPSDEPGLAEEAEPGSQAGRPATRGLLPWRSLPGRPGAMGTKRPSGG